MQFAAQCYIAALNIRDSGCSLDPISSFLINNQSGTKHVLEFESTYFTTN